MVTREWLISNYVQQRKSLKQCADLVCCHPADIRRAMLSCGIPTRSRREAYYLAIKEGRRITSLSEERRERISRSKKGYRRSVDSIEKQKLTIKQRLSNCGRRPTHGKGYYLNINGDTVYFRSSWECKYAVHLIKSGKEWKHEPTTFVFENGISYTPDFWVEGDYFEVKGWLQPRHLAKAKMLLLEYGVKVNFVLKEDMRNTNVSWSEVEPLIVATSGNLTVECLECGQVFIRSRRSSKFCSTTCSNTHWRNIHSVFLQCITCGVEYRRPPSVARLSRFCSRTCKDKYGHSTD
jgi:hypothetical protein